ncbi:hypothetical protein J6590_036025 [Homalodisca vitripennis]|nr:hypothetical protein J6590_036025 [Homalodisca vitripennis]
MDGCKYRAQITSTKITITHHTSTGYSGILVCILCSDNAWTQAAFGWSYVSTTSSTSNNTSGASADRSRPRGRGGICNQSRRTEHLAAVVNGGCASDHLSFKDSKKLDDEKLDEKEGELELISKFN